MFATLDMTMLAGLAFDTNGRFIGLRAPAPPTSAAAAGSAPTALLLRLRSSPSLRRN
jgi:hypothetical protein